LVTTGAWKRGEGGNKPLKRRSPRLWKGSERGGANHIRNGSFEKGKEKRFYIKEGAMCNGRNL